MPEEKEQGSGQDREKKLTPEQERLLESVDKMTDDELRHTYLYVSFGYNNLKVPQLLQDYGGMRGILKYQIKRLVTDPEAFKQEYPNRQYVSDMLALETEDDIHWIVEQWGLPEAEKEAYISHLVKGTPFPPGPEKKAEPQAVARQEQAAPPPPPARETVEPKVDRQAGGRAEKTERPAGPEIADERFMFIDEGMDRPVLLGVDVPIEKDGRVELRRMPNVELSLEAESAFRDDVAAGENVRRAKMINVLREIVESNARSTKPRAYFDEASRQFVLYFGRAPRRPDSIEALRLNMDDLKGASRRGRGKDVFTDQDLSRYAEILSKPIPPGPEGEKVREANYEFLDTLFDPRLRLHEGERRNMQELAIASAFNARWKHSLTKEELQVYEAEALVLKNEKERAKQQSREESASRQEQGPAAPGAPEDKTEAGPADARPETAGVVSPEAGEKTDIRQQLSEFVKAVKEFPGGLEQVLVRGKFHELIKEKRFRLIKRDRNGEVKAIKALAGELLPDPAAQAELIELCSAPTPEIEAWFEKRKLSIDFKSRIGGLRRALYVLLPEDLKSRAARAEQPAAPASGVAAPRPAPDRPSAGTGPAPAAERRGTGKETSPDVKRLARAAMIGTLTENAFNETAVRLGVEKDELACEIFEQFPMSRQSKNEEFLNYIFDTYLSDPDTAYRAIMKAGHARQHGDDKSWHYDFMNEMNLLNKRPGTSKIAASMKPSATPIAPAAPGAMTREEMEEDVEDFMAQPHAAVSVTPSRPVPSTPAPRRAPEVDPKYRVEHIGPEPEAFPGMDESAGYQAVASIMQKYGRLDAAQLERQAGSRAEAERLLKEALGAMGFWQEFRNGLAAYKKLNVKNPESDYVLMLRAAENFYHLAPKAETEAQPESIALPARLEKVRELQGMAGEIAKDKKTGKHYLAFMEGGACVAMPVPEGIKESSPQQMEALYEAARDLAASSMAETAFGEPVFRPEVEIAGSGASQAFVLSFGGKEALRVPVTDFIHGTDMRADDKRMDEHNPYFKQILVENFERMKANASANFPNRGQMVETALRLLLEAPLKGSETYQDRAVLAALAERLGLGKKPQKEYNNKSAKAGGPVRPPLSK